jgi:protein involved in polysaccharide export with SLBB domain
MRIAKPRAEATHVRVVRNTGTVRNVEYYPLGAAGRILLSNGDELQFTADKKPGTITVRVEGEHQSAQEYVLPYGTRVGELLQKIQYSERSDAASPQLFRDSVRQRQKDMLQTALKSLESSVLTARSGTSDEARLRKEEADLILQWVDRAKSIEPRGQVVIAQAAERDNLLLENGDIIRIPTKDGLVLVSGEVLFPNAIAFDARLAVDDYVRLAGGYTQNADNSRIVIAHPDGSFADGKGARAVRSQPTNDAFWWRDQGTGGAAVAAASGIRAGDEILVLPKVDVKSRQILKDMMQIIYQLAISARVVTGI